MEGPKPHRLPNRSFLQSQRHYYCLRLLSGYMCDSQHFEKDKYPLWRYHAVVLSLSLGLCVLMACTHGLGKSAFQDCTLRKGSWTE